MKNILLISLVVLSIVFLFEMLVPSGGMHMMHNFYYYNNVVTYLFVIVIVIILVTILLDSFKKTSSPMRILDERLAKGKISIEEYDRISDLIQRRKR